MNEQLDVAVKDQLSIAIDLAIKYHGDQKYGDAPYIFHLYQVDQNYIQMYMRNLAPGEPYSKEFGDDVDCLRAICYLHDILEDTECTSMDLREAGLCDRVIYGVECITKIEGQPYNAYIDVVLCNEDSRKVKLCDTAANLSNSLKDMNAQRINKYTKQIQLLGGFRSERR